MENSKVEVIALKKLRAYLRERGCEDIQFYPKKDLNYSYEGNEFILHGVYLITFFIKPNLKYNLFLRFNTSNALFYLPNNQSTLQAVYSLKTDDLQKFQNLLANKDSSEHANILAQLGFKLILPKPHSKFIKFLSTRNSKEINMTIEILKFANLAPQVTNNFTQDYYDTFTNFINNLITNIT